MVDIPNIYVDDFLGNPPLLGANHPHRGGSQPALVRKSRPQVGLSHVHIYIYIYITPEIIMTMIVTIVIILRITMMITMMMMMMMMIIAIHSNDTYM